MTDQPKPAPPSFESYRPRDERQFDAPNGKPCDEDSPLSAEFAFRSARPEAPFGARRRAGLRRAPVAAALVSVALVAAVSTFLYAAPPARLIERKIKAAVQAETGRDLSIGGTSSFRLFPTPGLVMREVTLSGTRGSDGGPLVGMKSLEADVALWPLLSGEVALGRVVLESPVFDLRIDKQGHRNWELAARAFSAPVPPTAITRSTPPAKSPSRAVAAMASAEASRDRLVGDLRIENGAVRYLDERTGLTQEVSDIAVDATLPGISRPLTANGEAQWGGERLTFEGALDSLAGLLDEKPAALTFTLGGAVLEGSYEGTFTLSAAPALKGAITAKGASLARLAAWLGGGGAFPNGPFSMTAEIGTLPKLIKLEKAAFEVDGASATGTVLADFDGERPLWRADLKLAQLDLSRSRRRASNAAAEKSDPPAPSVNDAGRRESPKAKGEARRGWSDEPIDWSALAAIDADLDLDIARVVRDEVKTGAARVTVALKDRALKAIIEDVALYGGRARGVLTVNGAAKEPALGVNVSGEDIDAKALLKDAAGFDWLSGKAKLSLDLSGAGGSERRIMETLKGTASVAVRDGAIAGVDAASVAAGKIADAAKKPGGATEFSELTAAFAVKGGVAENQDLRITGPLLAATGAGKVSLAKREIDYTIRPKPTPDAGAGDADPSSTLEVPVRVTGPWEKPKFAVDLKGVLAEPDKTVSAIKRIGKKLKGKKIGDIVRGLLDKDADSGEEGAPSDAPRGDRNRGAPPP